MGNDGFIVTPKMIEKYKSSPFWSDFYFSIFLGPDYKMLENVTVPYVWGIKGAHHPESATDASLDGSRWVQVFQEGQKP